MNNVAGLKAKFATFLKATILLNICERLFLFFVVTVKIMELNLNGKRTGLLKSWKYLLATLIVCSRIPQLNNFTLKTASASNEIFIKLFKA